MQFLIFPVKPNLKRKKQNDSFYFDFFSKGEPAKLRPTRALLMLESERKWFRTISLDRS